MHLVKFRLAATATALILAGSGLDALAQTAPGGGGSLDGTPPSASSGQFTKNLTQDDLQKLGDYADEAQRLTKGSKDAEAAKRLAAHKAEAQAIAASLNISCDITDAVEAGEGDAKGVKTKIYEAACGNGMGYFLISRQPGSDSGYSCFTAEATRVSDLAKGVTNGFYCQLPANKDIKAMAAKLMARAGTTCAVGDLQWFGQNKSLEYTEVKCGDGRGYLLSTPLPGTATAPSVMSCQDAAQKGFDCKLTKVAAAAPKLTLQIFKDAIAQHGIKCSASDERVMGQENALKRYVVEFKCPEYPGGLVAFVPLSGNSAKFETQDCAAAAKRHLMCKFTAAK